MNTAGVLRGRLRLLRNTLLPRGRNRSSRRLGAALFGVALAAVLAALIGIALASLFSVIASTGGGAAESAAALALLFTAALFGLLVFDLHEAVTTLLADSDLDLLRRAPVAPTALFAIKLLDALPRTSLLLIVLAVPATVAFHLYFPLPPWGWLLLPVQLAALWLMPLGLGTAAALFLLRFAPARHTREALGLLSTLTLFLLWLANSFLLPSLAGNSADPLGPLRDLLHAVPAAYAWSPGLWAADALAAAARGDLPRVVSATALLATAGAASLALAAGMASLGLETVQSRLAAGAGGRRVRRAPAARIVGGSRPRGFIVAVATRDLMLLARNWTVLGDLVTAAVLWTLLPIVGTSVFDVEPPRLARAMMLALTVALGYELAARALPMERGASAWMRLAPVRPLRWVLARLAAVAIVAGSLLALAAAGTFAALGIGARDAAATLCIAVPALALSLATGLWTGASFGDAAWINPRAMLTFTGRIVSTTLLLGQAGAWFLFAALADAWHAALPPGTALWAPAAIVALLLPLLLRATAARIARLD